MVDYDLPICDGAGQAVVSKLAIEVTIKEYVAKDARFRGSGPTFRTEEVQPLAGLSAAILCA